MKRASIGDLLRDGAIVEVQDGNHGEKHPTSADYVEDRASDGVPFVMARDFPRGSLDLRNVTLLRRDVAERLRVGFARPGDVLLTHKGTVGATGIVPGGVEYVMLTPQVTYYRTNPNRLLNTYLRCAFRAPEFQQQLSSLSAQSTRPFVSITAQRGLMVPVVSIAVQRRISGIVTAYDDLIENCARRIHLLDEMARALYREWFVLFRYPGHEKTPPFIESSRGRVPRGWRYDTIRTAAQVNADQVNVKQPPARIRYIDISSVSPGHVHTITEYEFKDAPGRARRVVHHGDVLWSCVRPNRRSHALVLSPEEDTIASTGFAVLTAEKVPFTYLYAATTTREFVDYLEKRATGAAYPAVTAKVFEDAPLLIPDAAILERFGGAATPFYERIEQFHREIESLRNSRDLLLPRLLSGALELPEAA